MTDKITHKDHTYRIKFGWTLHPVVMVRVLDKEGYFHHWRTLKEGSPKWKEIIDEARKE